MIKSTGKGILGWTLVGLALTLTSLAKAEDKGKYEVNGYWRLGINTSPTYLEDTGNTSGNTQGYGQFGDLKTSRHTRGPSYFWLQMKRKFEDESEAVVRIDSEANLVHENGTWSDPESNMLRVRDLYYSMQFGKGNQIWAGARTLEWEDIRIFDYLNYFNVNAHGVGVKLGDTQVVASFAREKIAGSKLTILDESGQPVMLPDEPGTNGEPSTSQGGFTATRRNTTLLVRHELSLSSNMSLKPMLKIDHYGAVPEDKSKAGQTREAIKGATGYSVGGVLSRWDKDFWENTHLWIGVKPVDTLGKESGNDMEYGIGDSASFDFGTFGVVTGVWAQQEKYKTARQVYKIENEKLVEDGTTTSDSTSKLSLAAQPMYYVTDHFHAGVDLSGATKTKKLSKDDYNCLLVTPLIRYAANKNPMGTPQIYTSVTYGMYDWKAKTTPQGEATRRLVTAQTGFETWF